MEDTEVFLTPEEQLAKFSDNIMASVLGNTIEAKTNRQYLFGQLSPDNFRDENHIIYRVLYNFKEQGITPNSEFLELYLLRNKKIILDATEYIDINAYSDIHEDSSVGYTAGVIQKFTKLETMEALNFDDFRLVIEEYKEEYKSLKFVEVCNQARLIASEGIQRGRKTLQGFDDGAGYFKDNLAKLEAVSDKTAGDGFIDASTVGLIDDADDEPVKVADFGDIDELNKHFGGIYTPNFYSISAPTKGGKTKFCTALIHNAVVKYGTNVAVWAHEGGYKAWLAQIRATHFEYYYNRNVSVEERIPGVNQDTILYKKWKDARIKELEEVSRQDLFSNPQYGNIQMIDRPFNVETFIDELETAIQLNGAQLVLIDYLQLIGSERNISKNERIGEAYQKLLAYIKKRNVAVLIPAQFKQEFMDLLSKSNDLSTIEARTGGGESAEITRTPDVNIALYASAEDLIHKRMTLLPIPSRMASPFMPFSIYADLSCCYFSSILE